MVSNTLTGPDKKKKANGKKGATEKSRDHLSLNAGADGTLQDLLTRSSDADPKPRCKPESKRS